MASSYVKYGGRLDPNTKQVVYTKVAYSGYTYSGRKASEGSEYYYCSQASRFDCSASIICKNNTWSQGTKRRWANGKHASHPPNWDRMWAEIGKEELLPPNVLDSPASGSRSGNSSLDRSRRSEAEAGPGSPGPGYTQFRSSLPYSRSGGPTHSSPRQPLNNVNMLSSVNIKRRRRSSSRESTPPVPMLAPVVASAAGTSRRSNSMVPANPKPDRAWISSEVEFLLELQCFNCHKIVGNPMYMCDSGHLGCTNCYAQFVTCAQPGCGKPFTVGTAECRLLRNLLKFVETSCPNNECNAQMNLELMNAHMESCGFRAVRCFQQHSFTCTGQEIPLQDYLVHLTSRHRCEPVNGRGNPYQLRIAIRLDSPTSPKTFTYAGKCFIINVICDEDNFIRIWTSTTASEAEASKFTANFKVQKPGGLERKLFMEWSSAVHNVHMSSNSVVQLGDCGLYPKAALRPYVFPRSGVTGQVIDDELTFTVQISNCADEELHNHNDNDDALDTTDTE